jgi:DNA repair protein RadC
MNTNDAPDVEIQLPLIDLTGGVSSPPRRRNRNLEKTLAQLRQLHDELNAQLYAHPTERPVVNSPQDVAQLFIPFIGFLDHEEMWVACLDTRNRLLCLVVLYKGSVNTSQIRVAEIFRQAIIENSTAIVLAHNHPSGCTDPSPDDIAVTRAIVQAGKLLDIETLDHLVIGGNRWVSLKERGLGFG